MTDFDSLGRLLLVLGAGLVLLGGLFMLLGRVPAFGNLPGDIRVEGSGFTCFAPIVSMLLLSIILTIIVNVIARIFTR